MTNVTFSVEKNLYAKMKQHPEIKWSEIFRKAIRDYLAFLERPKTISGAELFASINIPTTLLSHAREMEIRKEQRELENKRAKKILELEVEVEAQLEKK
jgi:hypothetical protein